MQSLAKHSGQSDKAEEVIRDTQKYDRQRHDRRQPIRNGARLGARRDQRSDKEEQAADDKETQDGQGAAEGRIPIGIASDFEEAEDAEELDEGSWVCGEGDDEAD